MKSRVLLLISLLFLFSACVAAAPANTPDTPAPPSAADTPAPEASASALPATATPLEQEAESEQISDPAPTATPSPEPTPTPGPQPPAPETARDLALDYLRAGYRYDLSADAGFEPADIGVALEGVTVIAGYASGPFQVAIGQARMAGERLLTPVNVRNSKTDASWWGDVDQNGLVTTLVAAKLPKPRSKRIQNWVGVVVKLPPGSPFDDYFQGEKGNRHGIASNKAGVNAVLERLGEYDGRVRVSGELRYAVHDDYNARRLLIDRIELLDGPLPESAAAAPAPDSTPAPEPEPALLLGPTGALTIPAPASEIASPLPVAGEAEGVFENSVLVRVEDARGAVLGQAFAVTDAPDLGRRGRFETAVEFTAPGGADAGRVALYSENAGDGGLLLLTWVNIRFAPSSGPRAEILLPEAGARIRDTVVVGGTAGGLSGNSVQVRVEGPAGAELGRAQAAVSAEGEWEVHVRFDAPSSTRSGRLAVYEIAADGSAVLLITLPVELQN